MTAVACLRGARGSEQCPGRPGFSAGLSAERATEILYTLMSEETYGLLVAEHGWTVPDWSAWARRHIQADLFPGI